MEPRNSTESPRRALVLLGLAAVLAGVFVWDQGPEWGDAKAPAVSAPKAAAPENGRTAAADPGTGNAEADQGAHVLAGLALDKLHDTIRRSLFEKTRRPVALAPAAAVVRPVIAPPQPLDPNALTLQGIVLNDGRNAIALLRRNQTGQSLRLQQGDSVDGWTVEQIEAERVHLVQGDTKINLQLGKR